MQVFYFWLNEWGLDEKKIWNLRNEQNSKWGGLILSPKKGHNHVRAGFSPTLPTLRQLTDGSAFGGSSRSSALKIGGSKAIQSSFNPLDNSVWGNCLYHRFILTIKVLQIILSNGSGGNKALSFQIVIGLTALIRLKDWQTGIRKSWQATSKLCCSSRPWLPDNIAKFYKVNLLK